MLFEVVRKHTRRPCCPTDFTQRIAQLLTLRRVRRDDAVGRVQRPLCADQGQVELAERGSKFVSDFYKWQLVYLVHDLFDFPLGSLQIASYGRQINRCLRPVYTHRLGIRKEIKCDQRSAGQQTSGSKLRANSLSDQTVDHLAPRRLQFGRRSLSDDLDAETLRIELDGHRNGELCRLHIDLRTNIRYPPDRDTAQLDGRTRNEAP